MAVMQYSCLAAAMAVAVECNPTNLGSSSETVLNVRHRNRNCDNPKA